MLQTPDRLSVFCQAFDKGVPRDAATRQVYRIECVDPSFNRGSGPFGQQTFIPPAVREYNQKNPSAGPPTAVEGVNYFAIGLVAQKLGTPSISG